MANKMSAKTKEYQNESANVCIDYEIQSILVENSETYRYRFWRTTDEMLNSNQEMMTDLQTIITDFTDFEKYVLQALASSNREDKYND